jgi:hypothetical protein
MAQRDRSGQINLTLTPAQKKALQRAADTQGVELTAFVRAVLALHVPDFPRDELPRGNPNIRTLRKKVNSVKKPLDK